MPQISHPDTDVERLQTLARRGLTFPAHLDHADVARLCAALLRLLDDDDVILQPRWRKADGAARLDRSDDLDRPPRLDRAPD